MIIFKAPEKFNFVDAVDLLYKVHKVFDLEFHTNSKHFMNFLDYYVYEDQCDGFITPTMRIVAQELLKVKDP